MGPPRLWLLATAASAVWNGAHGQNPNLILNTPIEACELKRQSGVTVSEYCGQRWAVMNAVQVPEFWEVHELEFYWDRYCTLPLPSGIPISSEVNSGFEENVPERAWDRLTSTMWTANCRALLGGCDPKTTWVGMNIGGDGMGVKAEAHHDYASIRCMKIYQSPNVSRQSLEIILGVFIDDTDNSFEELEHYREFSGGAWQMRPGFEAGIWRLKNYVATPRPWKVAELLLYSDRFCHNEELHGVPIASGSFLPHDCIDPGTCDAFPPWKAFDGERRPGHPYPEPLPSMWQAACHEFSGCESMTAWIGMDYGFQPVTLQCIRIFQPTHDGYPDFGHPTFTPTLVSEFWDGYQWRQDEVLYGLGHGGWNETRPRAGYAWRLNNYDFVQDSWRVYELQLFRSRTCGDLGFRDRELGLPIDSNPKLPFSQQDTECRLQIGSCGFLTHDRKIGTAWQSSCRACDRAEAWVGLLFDTRPRDVLCFKVIQSGEQRYRTDAVELSMWDGEEWVVQRFESGVGGGTWNYRPTEPMSAWRFLGTSVTDLAWKVHDIAFYSDAACNHELLDQEIGSGGTPARGVSYAFDHDNTTLFEASCPPRFTGSQGCTPGSSWLGRQAGSGTLSVRCVRLQQHQLRAHQVSVAVVQQWDGLRWVPSSNFEPLTDFGGGMWQSFPGQYSSMWRLRSQTVTGGTGLGVAELELFRGADCTEKIQVAYPNLVPISSGFSSSRDVAFATGSSAHFMTMGDFGQAYPEYAFDGNLGTFWAELEARPAWVGVDMNNQIADVQCVKVAFAGLRSLQPAWSWMEAWDGTSWTAHASGGGQAVLRFPLLFPGGGGWQIRPAPLQSMWRLQNDVEVEAWKISEIEFYISTDCRGDKLTGQPIASARTTPNGVQEGGHRLPALAFDGSLETIWEADCELSGCLAGNAWIGLNLPTPARVRCLRMAQGATRTTQTSTVTLAFWQGDGWEVDSQLSGLGGGTWNMRPAMPDSMWRVVFMERQDEPCDAFPSRPYRRSWGVSELQFFSDDDCQIRLPGPAEGAEPIASGMRVPEAVGRGILLDSFAPKWAFDGSTTSYWAAQCGAVGRQEANCMPGGEWIGLDFGTVSRGLPVEVRCVRIHQSRNIASECCDPASKMSLQRWNGTAWKEAVWRHLPRERGPMGIEGDFSGLGRCPSIAEQVTSDDIDLWEQRTRRQSEVCAVPLSGAVPLLADPLCSKHSRCREAGFTGVCCPLGGDSITACAEQGFEAAHCSRCCCDVVSDQIFEDQLDLDIDRRPIDEAPVAGIELVAIRTINVMPYIGLAFTIFLYLAANSKPPSSFGCYARLWFVCCWPVHLFMHKGGIMGSVLAFMCRRNPGERVSVLALKRVLTVVMGLIVGTYLLWILISMLVAEIILRAILLLSMVVRFAKSPFDPEDEGDRKRFQIVLAVPFTGDTTQVQIPAIGDMLRALGEACVQAVVYSVKGVLDIILIRFSLMSIDTSFSHVAIPDILVQMPQLPFDVHGMMDVLFQLTKVFSDLFLALISALFKGIPRCEGPVLIFSGMSLVVITLVLIRCLNYDYFGLLMATRHTVKNTRPIFQKTMFLAIAISIQSGIFVVMQCVMLLFARALTLADFNEDHWMCPYSGEGISALSGRVFLIMMTVFAAVIIFLSADGHFLGQSYLTAEFAKRIDMSLERLDPDGQDAMVRTTSCFSMLPTTLGIWIDGWNVKGYLIKERANIYAEELKFPQMCPHCGVCHVPYWEVMKATGMQLSLAYQWFPFGVVIGKACEYLNNPPLLYIGSELKCMNVKDNLVRARMDVPKKMSASKAIVYYCGILNAHVRDNLVPLLVKLFSVAIYTAMIVCTYMIDRHNIRELGYLLFACLLSFASAKAFFEFFLPVLALFFLGAVLIATKRREKGAENREAFRFLAPFFGQLAHAVPAGMAVAIYLAERGEQEGGSMARDFATLIGCTSGIAAGLLMTAIALALEQCPGSNLSGKLFVASYGCALSIGIGRVLGNHLTTDQQYVVMAFVAVFIVPISGLTFRLPPLDDDRVREPSAVLPLLTTPRLLSCIYGSLAGVFVGAYWHRDIANLFKDNVTIRYGGILGLLVCGALGYACGLVYTFVTDHVIKRRAGQWAILVGTTLTVSLGLAVHWLAGILIGSAAGTIVGAFLEQLQLQAVRKVCFESARFTKSKIAGNPVSSGAEMNSGPPTVLKAWMASNAMGVDSLVLATTGLSNTAPMEAEETLRVPDKKSKKYTLGRGATIPPAGPRDAWNPDASSPVPGEPRLAAQHEGYQHPALREQSMSAAGRAQLAATLRLADPASPGSTASSAQPSARSRQPSSRNMASPQPDHLQRATSSQSQSRRGQVFKPAAPG